MPNPEIDIPYDGIITLVVFLIGVPTLVFQTMAPDVLRIFFERKRSLVFLGGLIILPIVIGLLVSSIGIFSEINSIGGDSIRWVIVFSTLVIVILVVAIYFPLRYGRRQGVLRLLEHEALRSLRRKGRLAEDAIENIIDLGKNAESPQEKNVVLQSIHSLVQKTCAYPSYTGDNLETPILKLHEIVVLDSQPPNLENFRMTAEILQEIAVARKEIQHVADLQRIVKAASGLGRDALAKFEFGLEIDNVIMSFVQTLSLVNYVKPLEANTLQHAFVMTEVSEALFEIGSLAAAKKRDFIAVAALDKLTTMLCQTSSKLAELPAHIVDELSADVVGLMAHIWIGGDSQKEFIRRRITDVRTYLGQPNSKLLRKARSLYLEKSQFETANNIAQMAKDLRARKRK